jgi:hypothetical protein
LAVAVLGWHSTAFAKGDKVTIHTIAHPGSIQVSTSGNVSATPARANASIHCPTDNYRPSSLGELSWSVNAKSSNHVAKTVNTSMPLSAALKKKLVEACKARLDVVAKEKKIQSSPMEVPLSVQVGGKCKRAKYGMFGLFGDITPPPGSATAQVPVNCEGLPTYALPSLSLSGSGTTVKCEGAADEIVWIITPAANPKAAASQPGKCPGSLDLATGPAALVGVLKVRVGAKYTPAMPSDEFHAVGNEVEITVSKKK